MRVDRGCAGRAGAAASLLVALGLLLACGPAEPRNLLLVSLDTVRPDHLPAYGYGRETAPATAALARRGAVFDAAFTQEANTAPSHASLFTGRYPHEHGCVTNRHRLDAGESTLAEVLYAAGFRTGAFVSGYPMRAALTGLHRGFEVYDDDFEGLRRDGRVTTERALRWLEEGGRERPYFLFLHLYDPHGPYRPPEGYEGLFRSEEPGPRLESIPRYQRLRDAGGTLRVHLNEYKDRYDAMIRYADDQVARVLDAVDLDETLVVLLSDHGETLGERHHRLDHGGQLFDEQMRIPLVMAGPGIPARRIDAMVETVDLRPGLLELLGRPARGRSERPGRSLARILRGGAAESGGEGGEAPRYVHAAARAESERHADRGYRLDGSRRILAVRSERWKLIRYPGVDGDPLELYDLAGDPGETHNVAREHPELRDAHRAELARWHDDRGHPPPELPEGVRERLEALGYTE